MRKYLLVIFVLVCCIASAQQIDAIGSMEKIFDKVKNKTSFKYDALSEIIQVGLNKGILTGNQQEFAFKSTLYGLMVLTNHDYEIDKNYAKLRFQRNFEFGGSMKLSEDTRIRGYSLALKYAIINKRDLSEGMVYERINPMVQHLQQSMASQLAPLMQTFMSEKDSSIVNKADKQKLTDYLKANKNIRDFQAFLDGLSKIINISPDKSLRKNMDVMQSELDALNEKYAAITKEIEKGPLLTFSAAGSNTDSYWDNMGFKLEYTKGLGLVKDDQNPWDLYLGFSFDMLKDSLSLKNNLNRSTSKLKGGINHVLLKDANNQSLVEVLGGFEYNTVYTGAYVNEKANQLNAAFTFSFRLAPNLYLPLDIKYDPDQAKFLGQLKLKWDMIRNRK